MKLRTKVFLIDATANYFLITPLVLLFWLGTYMCLDEFLFDKISNRLTAALISLFFGLSIEFCLHYWQDAIGSMVAGALHESSGLLARLGAVLYSRFYNYILAVGNIAHYRGIQELYDMFIAPQDDGKISQAALAEAKLSMAFQTAAATIVVLWAMRASRNITAVPFCVGLDTDMGSWFQASTLYQYEKHRTVEYLLDTILTVVVVWTLRPLHWITLGYVFDLTVFPDSPMTSMLVSCLVGYGVVGLCTFIQFTVRNFSVNYERDSRRLLKILLEDLYIYVAAAAFILTWKGMGMAADMFSKAFPITYGGTDYTGLAANIIPFLLLSLGYASGSLVGKGADLDGSLSDGAGVDFSIDYFGHFFSDYISEKEKEEQGKKQQ